VSPGFTAAGAFSAYVSEPIIGGTILFHEIVLMEQPNKTLRSSLRLELSVEPLEKLLDLVPNGTFPLPRRVFPPPASSGQLEHDPDNQVTTYNLTAELGLACACLALLRRGRDRSR
jgi:hypothetical protein